MEEALDALRRLSPNQVTQNLELISQIAPDLSEDLLAAVDQPLQGMVCPDTNREFLICDYNRDCQSYRFVSPSPLLHNIVRSPWTNKFVPPLADATTYPSPNLRKLEVAANDAFDTYRELWVVHLYCNWFIQSVTFREGSHPCTCGTLMKDSLRLYWSRNVLMSFYYLISFPSQMIHTLLALGTRFMCLKWLKRGGKPRTASHLRSFCQSKRREDLWEKCHSLATLRVK